MRICQSHWEKLRAAIDARGMTPLVARTGREAMERAVEELDGSATDATFDPLMAANNAISARALEHVGLFLLTGDYCPICEFCKHIEPPPAGHEYADNESYMIDGPADAMQEYVRSSAPLCALLGWSAEPEEPGIDRAEPKPGDATQSHSATDSSDGHRRANTP